MLLKNPFKRYRIHPRGMKFLFDLIDWIGGYRFEVATPSEVEKWLLEKGFVLIEMKTVGSKLGCNECLWKKSKIKK